jgi:hypothetical protein
MDTWTYSCREGSCSAMGDQLRNLSAPQCTDTESRDLRFANLLRSG